MKKVSNDDAEETIKLYILHQNGSGNGPDS